jgi:sugar phosphate isomerase/epimerase
MLLLGGPVFADSEEPGAIARAHRLVGYRAATYAGKLSVADREGVREARRAFEKEGVLLAEVPAFGVSLLGDDRQAVHRAVEHVAARLALADELGALCAVNIAGSYAADGWYAPHERNFSRGAFDQAVEVARAIVDLVKPRRAKMSYEMMSFNFLDSPQSYVDFLHAVDRPTVAVHMDPVNCISSPRTFFAFSTILGDCFRLLGPRIVSCHAKDMRTRHEPVVPQFDEVRPGTGIVDYRQFLSLVKGLGRDVPLIMEHLATEAEYFAARDYITAVARKLGMA